MQMAEIPLVLKWMGKLSGSSHLCHDSTEDPGTGNKQTRPHAQPKPSSRLGRRLHRTAEREAASERGAVLSAPPH